MAGTIGYEIATGLEHPLAPRAATGTRWMSASARSSAARRHGSSAARSATCCWTAGARPRRRVPRTEGGCASLRAPLRRSGVPALRSSRCLARRGRRNRGDGRLHAACRRDRGRSRDEGLHVQRDRRPSRAGESSATRTEARPTSRTGSFARCRRSIFVDDPLRLLRAVRLEEELGFTMDAETEELLRRSATLVTRPAGERILAELRRLSPAGYPPARRPSVCLPSSAARSTTASTRSTTRTSGSSSSSATGSRGCRSRTTCAATRKCSCARALPRTRPHARSIASAATTEPWTLDALAFVGATELAGVVEAARAAEPPSRSSAETSSACNRGPRSDVSSRHRRGAGSGNDLDARRGARARAASSAEASG